MTVQNPESSAMPALPTIRALSPPLDEEALSLNPPSAEMHETEKTVPCGLLYGVVKIEDGYKIS